MKTEALEEADSRREGQSSDKSKRQCAVVDLAFVLIIRPKEAQEKQDGRRYSCDSKDEQGRAERQNAINKADGNDREDRHNIEEQERGSTAVR